jgi:hypothetical protein
VKRAGDLFGQVVSLPNLLAAFRGAARGKRNQAEVIRYRYELEPRLFALRDRLEQGEYRFGPYRAFRLCDPKPRRIVVAPFEDRVVHHALHNVLGPVFEPTFIHDSYACRPGKGTHAAVLRLQRFLKQAGDDYVLQCDVRKYFASMDHQVLKGLVQRKVKDARVLALVDRLIDSAPPEPGFGPGKGLPIGNLTSQLLANVQLDPLDHFVKETLRQRRYARYVDDFLVVGGERSALVQVKEDIGAFLRERLRLRLHEHKCHVFPGRRGVTFLGYRVWPDRIRVKTTTLVRMRRRERWARAAMAAGEITEEVYWQSVSAMIGHVRWGDPWGVLQAELAQGVPQVGGVATDRPEREKTEQQRGWSR